ncbi:MAG TPA: UbiA family prenyltransferase, partial [Candidatus Competibacteraceae bacterium]|nr:UbiA family prenyltransferase [Candidatus Competibacteraceae bacterium]
AGTYYLQTGRVDTGALRAGALLGLLAAAVLAVNNHRDRDSDRIAGRRTLALRLGPQATHGLYALLILGPFLLVPTLHLHGLGPWSWLLPELALPWALRLAVRFWRTGGTGLNAVLVATVHLELYFGLLLALGVVLDHTPP